MLVKVGRPTTGSSKEGPMDVTRAACPTSRVHVPGISKVIIRDGKVSKAGGDRVIDTEVHADRTRGPHLLFKDRAGGPLSTLDDQKPRRYGLIQCNPLGLMV